MIKEFEVHCKSGYIAVSGDGTMVAVAVLKEDTVDIYELTTGDLLLSLDGGRREGFWGSLQFLRGSNRLIELRSIEYARGVSKRNIMRCWDLGFATRRDPTGDERVPSSWNEEVTFADSAAASFCPVQDIDDDDDVEEKKWEIQMWKGPNAISYCWDDDTLFASSEEERKVSVFEARTGNCNPKRNICEGKFCAKIVFSSDCAVFALSHTGSCSVRDSKRNGVLSVIEMPDVPFPVTPQGFICKDCLLVLRINLDRYLIVCDWRNPKDMFILREAGGTTTDACAISPDEKYLACWPHGFIEYYSLDAIVEGYKNKIPRMKRYTTLFMRQLFLAKRAAVSVEEKRDCATAVKVKKEGGKSKSAFFSDKTTKDSIRDYWNRSLDNPAIWTSLCTVDDDTFRYILGFV